MVALLYLNSSCPTTLVSLSLALMITLDAPYADAPISLAPFADADAVVVSLLVVVATPLSAVILSSADDASVAFSSRGATCFLLMLSHSVASIYPVTSQ